MSQAHPISRYLESAGRKVSDLARASGTSRQTLYRLIKGEQEPSAALARRIKEATDGAITMDDLAAQAPEKPERELAR